VDFTAWLRMRLLLVALLPLLWVLLQLLLLLLQLLLLRDNGWLLLIDLLMCWLLHLPL
jgi:hypothetical protein